MVECGRTQILDIADRTDSTVCEVLGSQEDCSLWLIAEGMANLREDGVMSDQYAVKTWMEYYANTRNLGSNAPAQSQPKPKSQSRSLNWGAISQLGKDIQSGAAWPSAPSPRVQAPRPSTACLQNGSYMSSDGKYKICLYSCGAGGQQSRTVSQHSMCPLSP